MSSYSDILYEVVDNVATITINRPERRNAFRSETLDELIDAFRAAEADREVGVIVLTGAGDKAFCAGGDIHWEEASDESGAIQMARRTTILSLVMRGCGKPIIARVRGFAVGGGNELQMLCDLTVASEDSRFGQSGPKMGSVPVWWGTQLLPRMVGEKKAREIIFLCEQYTAREALDMGLINKVVPVEELDTTVRAWCDRMLTLSPQALRVAKISLNYESDQLWPSVLHGNQMISFIHGTEEFHEGTRAFLEKRPPEFGKFRK
ncbi:MULTISPECIES: enoyl-CoA hydratase-related protein [unclassified Micromonospora]|uniref:enoyl-CoA hydratase-related protein n=1 Tax=unclassified Micromonospora TaxID=2617518 RepID=UPI001B35AE13|nr:MULTISPECIES: enoyl-CoA hydratase-related protein [unclassified Micromonospora]MBQ1041017.1 enoyl-CoA hydratase/isomerase family protein [Micromonospora sp. C72]MBQ1055182.1 enoyl-CoA hydratase/isomerase family protein [Micromonospora sp. C32]